MQKGLLLAETCCTACFSIFRVATAEFRPSSETHILQGNDVPCSTCVLSVRGGNLSSDIERPRNRLLDSCVGDATLQSSVHLLLGLHIPKRHSNVPRRGTRLVRGSIARPQIRIRGRDVLVAIPTAIPPHGVEHRIMRCHGSPSSCQCPLLNYNRQYVCRMHPQ